MEKLEHFQHILLFEFNRGAKAAEAARNIVPCMGTMPSERARPENDFLVWRKDCFDISDTPRPERPLGFDAHRLNTLIHNDRRQCTRELANVMNCGHSTIVDICIQWTMLKNSGVCVPHTES